MTVLGNSWSHFQESATHGLGQHEAARRRVEAIGGGFPVLSYTDNADGDVAALQARAADLNPLEAAGKRGPGKYPGPLFIP
jgi:hypothetical protein